jgi:vancomycin permeability regulator SanA
MRRRFLKRIMVVGLVALAALLGGPAIWEQAGSSGRISDVAHAPAADVGIVFGAQVGPDRRAPMTLLRGRLDRAVELLKSGKVRALLLSGDEHGGSGDEVRVMRDYLVEHGADPARLVLDPYGLDTYDTCRRAHDVYGVNTALLVSQSLHLHRAITLCRRLGIDARGVAAGCGCKKATLLYNWTREIAAGPKAAFEALVHRKAAVQSPPDGSLTRAAGY